MCLINIYVCCENVPTIVVAYDELLLPLFSVQFVNTHWCWNRVVWLPIIFGWCKQLQMCFDLVAHKSAQIFDSCCDDNTNP
jgi:hypothetical protein